MRGKALSLWSVFILLTFIIFTQVGGEYLFFHFFSNASDLQVLWFIGCTRLLNLGLIFFFIYRFGKGFESASIFPAKWLKGIYVGGIISLIFGVLVFSTWIFFLFFHINLFRFLFSPNTKIVFEKFIWLLIIGGIFAPVVEDTFFIGCLYNSLREKVPLFLAVISTALFFALLHGLGSFPITQFIGGLLFIIAFEYTDNLLTPITIHITGNCVLFIISYSSLIKTFLLKWA